MSHPVSVVSHFHHFVNLLAAENFKAVGCSNDLCEYQRLLHAVILRPIADIHWLTDFLWESMLCGQSCRYIKIARYHSFCGA